MRDDWPQLIVNIICNFKRVKNVILICRDRQMRDTGKLTRKLKFAKSIQVAKGNSVIHSAPCFLCLENKINSSNPTAYRKSKSVF